MKENIKLNIFIFVIIICFVMSIIFLNIFNKKVLPIFMNYTVSELKVISTRIINKAVNDEISKLKDIQNMIIVTKGNDDEIQVIDFDSVMINGVLKSITENILVSLSSIEEGSDDFFSNNYSINEYSGGIVYEVPVGIITDNLFLGNLGPKIPVRLSIIGDVLTNVKTEVKEYGINNALIEISLNVNLTEKVVIPFISETVNVSVDIPISLKLIQGNIPLYYGNSLRRESNILSVPTN